MTHLDYISQKRKKLACKKSDKNKNDNSLKILKLLKLEAEDTNKSFPQIVEKHNLESWFPHYFL